MPAQSAHGGADPVRSALATSLATRGAGGSAGRQGRGETESWRGRGGSESAGGGGELTSAAEYYGLSCAGCCFSALGSSQGGKRRVNMELSAVGERVFAAEALLKRRIRKVGAPGPWAEAGRALPSGPGFPPPAAAQLPFPQVPSAAAAAAAAAALSSSAFLRLAAMHRLHGWGAGWGDECRCMHFVQRFVQGARRAGGGRVPFAIGFHAFIWCMHFCIYFLCPPQAFLPCTHTFPPLHPQGRMEYLVKWKGWSQK